MKLHEDKCPVGGISPFLGKDGSFRLLPSVGYHVILAPERKSSGGRLITRVSRFGTERRQVVRPVYPEEAGCQARGSLPLMRELLKIVCWCVGK
jgi:hypothetical protein